MLLPILRAPARVLRRPTAHNARSSNALDVAALNFCPYRVPLLPQVRHATHGAQGRANGPKNGPGKRLGAKKTGDEYVIPGNIIFRQRGTNWHPGHNVGMGRDHTIFASETGFVKYYRDPARHAKRRYIGVVFERHQTLPLNPAAPRQRRLGMLAVPRAQPASEEQERSGLGIMASLTEPSGVGSTSVAQTPNVSTDVEPRLSSSQRREARRKIASGRLPSENLKMGPDYSYRESNYEIGRSADRAGVTVKKFDRSDRFRAWRKTMVRRKRRAEKNAMGRKKPGAKKGVKGKAQPRTR